MRFGPALKAFLLCLLIGGSGIGYVWQKNQLFELGRHIKQREQRLIALEAQNEKLKNELGMMHSLSYLERQIKERNLGLGPPQPAQVRWLPEPARDPSKSEGETQFAAQGVR
jgi:hypothetical protein